MLLIIYTVIVIIMCLSSKKTITHKTSKNQALVISSSINKP